mgnify:CR=1 FL=1
MKMVLKVSVTTDKQRSRSIVCNSHENNELQHAVSPYKQGSRSIVCNSFKNSHLQDAENLTSGEKGAIIVV